ncbi:MAG TPA: hypothetical protein VFQ34_01335 [Nitrospiraceae bacterium]|nr:hypothetical protein [Nitrospiraceae bacterium]
MNWLSRNLIVLSCALLSACVSVRVDPLTPVTFEPREKGEKLATLDREPNRRYVEIARIVATSEQASEDSLRDRILSQAKKLGADAVVLGKADVRRSSDRGPVFQSTMAAGLPAPVTDGAYRSNYWNPFRADAWSVTQGAGGGQTWMLHMSGLAIRYVTDEEWRAMQKQQPAKPQ